MCAWIISFVVLVAFIAMRSAKTTALGFQLNALLLCVMASVMIQKLMFARTRLSETDSFVRRDAMLAAGLCASCAYAINEVRVQPDDCSICPECGAAWKLPHPPATTAPPHTTTSTGFPPNS